MTPAAYVLVIDDEPDVLSTLAAVLAAEGHCVACARDGAEAIERLCEPGPPPDVIVLDLHMPGMDGHEFRRVQQRYLRWATIPVIVLAGVPPSDELVTSGMAAVLTKPVAPEVLLATIAQVLRRDAGSDP